MIGVDATDAVLKPVLKRVLVSDILEQLIERIPPPVGDVDAPLLALIIDSWFDNYWGVVSLVRVKQGCLRVG